MSMRTSSFFDPTGMTQASGADDFYTRDGMARRQIQSQDAELRARMQDAAANRALQLQMGGSFAERAAADTHQAGMQINRDVDLARLQNQGNIATQGTFDQQRMARQAELAQAGGLAAEDRTARFAQDTAMQGMRGEQAMGLGKMQGEQSLAQTELANRPVMERNAMLRTSGDREWAAGAGERGVNDQLHKLKSSLFADMAGGSEQKVPLDERLRMLAAIQDPGSVGRRYESDTARADAMDSQRVAAATAMIANPDPKVRAIGAAILKQTKALGGQDFSGIVPRSPQESSVVVEDFLQRPEIKAEMSAIVRAAQSAQGSATASQDASLIKAKIDALRNRAVAEGADPAAFESIIKEMLQEHLPAANILSNPLSSLPRWLGYDMSSRGAVRSELGL